MRLTTYLNLPAPGRRQCLYVGLENAFADTCVFAKQSLGTIHCGRSLLPLTGHILPAPLLPKLRGHFAEFLLRKSLEPLRLLASPTCVGLRYGHHQHLPREAFLGSRLANPLTRPCGLFGIGSRLSRRICLPGNVYDLTSAQPPADGLLAPASPLGVKRCGGGTGILTRFPSVTPFGLTLGTD